MHEYEKEARNKKIRSVNSVCMYHSIWCYRCTDGIIRFKLFFFCCFRILSFPCFVKGVSSTYKNTMFGWLRLGMVKLLEINFYLTEPHGCVVPFNSKSVDVLKNNGTKQTVVTYIRWNHFVATAECRCDISDAYVWHVAHPVLFFSLFGLGRVFFCSLQSSIVVCRYFYEYVRCDSGMWKMCFDTRERKTCSTPKQRERNKRAPRTNVYVSNAYVELLCFWISTEEMERESERTNESSIELRKIWQQCIGNRIYYLSMCFFLDRIGSDRIVWP